MATGEKTKPSPEIDLKADAVTRKQLLRRFWRVSGGFWRRDGDRRAWILTGVILTVILIQLFFQYQMNVWNRSLFDAREQKNA